MLEKNLEKSKKFKKKLNRDFFAKSTLEVAENLLGKVLFFKDKTARIYETEAYFGDDPASHASRGKTKRNSTMFEKPGISYVYLIYGVYHCLNFSTEKKNYPSAVLIRGAIPIIGFEPKKNETSSKMLCDGPGKLCRSFGITIRQNEIDICNCKDFFIFDDGETPKKIKKTPRIGISKNTDKLWRFLGSF